jgi:hypothetical protein
MSGAHGQRHGVHKNLAEGIGGLVVGIASVLLVRGLLKSRSKAQPALALPRGAAATLAKGADTLINRGIKMEVLDALAVGLAAGKGEVYTANITDFLLSLGEFLERRTERQSDRLLRRLLRPEPVMAWVERNGELLQVGGDEVQAGEIVAVGVGETVPVDGRVVDGAALVNQAAVTGEDVPVRKEAPRRVIAGSTLVEGRIRIEAPHVGDDTTTARVSRFIQDSLGKQSDTQRLADQLADKRVYLTLGTGGLVYALTRDLTRLQAVFLVDYSCALKLGTPVAFKSGMYRAAAHGEVDYMVAHGMAADVNGGRIFVGSRHYLEACCRSSAAMPCIRFTSRRTTAPSALGGGLIRKRTRPGTWWRIWSMLASQKHGGDMVILMRSTSIRNYGSRHRPACALSGPSQLTSAFISVRHKRGSLPRSSLADSPWVGAGAMTASARPSAS